MLASLLRLLTASAVFIAQTTNAFTTTTVTIPTGATVTGLLEPNGPGRNVKVFRGVPYAEPPVGDKRWKPSTIKTPTGAINATAFGDTCVPFYAGGTLPKYSEDCLFVNIFTPEGVTKQSKLPVMVWIHGGALLNGNSNWFDPRGIVAASKDKVIVLTINYRVGAFGFLSSKQLLAEGNGANFGLRDQEVAFQWMQKYIQHFGGDPKDITVFAGSAGAWSIASHMVARDGNQKLFNRAILMSGAYASVHDTPPPAVSQGKADYIAKTVGCDTAPDVMACLRQTNSSAIAAIKGSDWRGFAWMPTVDNVWLLDLPINRLRAGKVSRVPTIIGTNADEGWYFTSWIKQESQMDAFLRSQFSFLTESEYTQILALYPASDFLTLRHRTGEIYGDSMFVCPSETFSLTLAHEHTYRYRFNFTTIQDGYPLVEHGNDGQYVFSQYGSIPADDTPRLAIAKYFQTFWSDFARRDSPTSEKVWPRFTTATKQQIVIQPTLGLETLGSDRKGHVARCAFWLQVEDRIAKDVKFF